jgi:type III secretion protein J
VSTMRATVAALCRASVVLTAYIFLTLLSGCKSELYGRLSEDDAHAVMVVLYGEGINATKVQVDAENWLVEVEEQDQQRALAITREHGVPRERFSNMGELFKKEGLVSTPSEVRMRYMYALSQEISNTLSRIDGVVSARVHPVIPINDPLSDKVAKSSAAVFIKHLPDADLQQMAPAIKKLVARSIDGLAAEDVSLTFIATRQPVQLGNGEAPTVFMESSTVANLGLFLGALLALTWGVFGWRLLRGQKKLLKSSTKPSAKPSTKISTPSNKIPAEQKVDVIDQSQ